MILCELFGVTTLFGQNTSSMPRSRMKKQCHGTLVTDALHVTRVIADSLSCAQVYDVLVGLLTSLRLQYVNSTDHCVPCTAR